MTITKMRVSVIAIVSLMLIALRPELSQAAGSAKCDAVFCQGQDQENHSSGAQPRHAPAPTRTPSKAPVKRTLTPYEKKVAAVKAENARRIASHQAAMGYASHCVAALNATGPNCPTRSPGLTLLPLPTPAKGGKPAAPALSPQQAAYAAVAQLTLPMNKPGIGPPPSVNRWKMAVVGYPLWLWSDGPTHVGPVSKTVLDASVSLEAYLTQTTFRMGDGGLVRCTGPGSVWAPSVTPGTPSASCGYRYSKPSLPKGSYTVTSYATWSVHWTAGDQAGVIDVPVASTTQLPVGELQALVR